MRQRLKDKVLLRFLQTIDVIAVISGFILGPIYVFYLIFFQDIEYAYLVMTYFGIVTIIYILKLLYNNGIFKRFQKEDENDND